MGAYILTVLAGIALGVVGVRLWQQQAGASPESDDARSAAAGIAEKSELRPSIQTPSTRMIFGGAGALALIALAVLIFKPHDDAQSAMAASGTSAPSAGGGTAQLDDVDTMISKLEARLQKNPADGEGFRMLGWSLLNTGHPAEAVTAYARAVQLLPNRADVHAGYGEALVGAAKDVVTPVAKEQFDAALKIDATEPRARYFASLFKAQNGDEKSALTEWIALANASDPGLPWQTDLRQRIDKLATKLGVNVTGQLKNAVPAALPTEAMRGPDAAAVKAAESLSESDRQSMINGMVDGLASRLKQSPDDVDGWVKLIRSRMVLKQSDKAKADLAAARAAFASQPNKLQVINSLAQELQL